MPVTALSSPGVPVSCCDGANGIKVELSAEASADPEDVPSWSQSGIPSSKELLYRPTFLLV